MTGERRTAPGRRPRVHGPARRSGPSAPTLDHLSDPPPSIPRNGARRSRNSLVPPTWPTPGTTTRGDDSPIKVIATAASTTVVPESASGTRTPSWPLFLLDPKPPRLDRESCGAASMGPRRARPQRRARGIGGLRQLDRGIGTAGSGSGGGLLRPRQDGHRPGVDGRLRPRPSPSRLPECSHGRSGRLGPTAVPVLWG